MSKKILQGIVISNKMKDTITVEVERKFRAPLYKKVIKRTKKFHVHDKGNRAQIGDVVKIIECRPISKTKHFRLYEIIKRNDTVKNIS